ncbi:MAG TPA: AMIN domain-containing protein [Methylomirabilota bacterium]|nr:AMIN domain-containing protein [Methylomirabilota bacterium]
MGQLRPPVPAGGRPLTTALVALGVGLALTLASVAGAQPERAPTERAQPEPSVELTEAAVIERDTAVEVWVRLSRRAKYQSELMDSPWRLVLDLEDTAYKWSARPVPVGIDPVRELRGSQYRKGATRLVIELSRRVAYTIEQDREGLRIVLPREGAARPKPASKAAPVAPAVRGVIVLNEQAHAYIFDPRTKQVRRYAVGDSVGDAVLEAIAERHVVLRTPTGRVELPVGDATRPDAAPTARPR